MDAEWTRIREIDSKMASLSTHIKKEMRFELQPS